MSELNFAKDKDELVEQLKDPQLSWFDFEESQIGFEDQGGYDAFLDELEMIFCKNYNLDQLAQQIIVKEKLQDSNNPSIIDSSKVDLSSAVAFIIKNSCNREDPNPSL